MGADPVAGVRALLAGGKLAPAGETEVNGRRVLLLRGDRPRQVLPNGRGVQLAVSVEYLVDAVINYPTFSEAYKVAALDVVNKLRALSQFRA